MIQSSISRRDPKPAWASSFCRRAGSAETEAAAWRWTAPCVRETSAPPSSAARCFDAADALLGGRIGEFGLPAFGLPGLRGFGFAGEPVAVLRAGRF